MYNIDRLKLSFILIFIMISFYILLIKTEKYESNSTVIIKDLSQKQNAASIGFMLLNQSSSVAQDSKLLELYINSIEMFNALDKIHKLTDYYSSNHIDFIQRLNSNSWFSFNTINNETILSAYNKDMSILYDELSNTLMIAYKHVDAIAAQKIVRDIILFSTQALNRFEKENTSVILNALLSQEQENKILFTDSIKKFIAYQNKHNTIDPNVDVQSKSTILATLESKLIQKEVEYKSKLSYLTKKAPEMKLIYNTIYQMKHSITSIKKQIVGNDKNELNQNVSNFELLKNEVDFNKERYKQTLIRLEETKVSIKQNAKNLIVITNPTLSTTHSEPEKVKDILTLFIILSLLYGIFTLIVSILKDHKD